MEEQGIYLDKPAQPSEPVFGKEKPLRAYEVWSEAEDNYLRAHFKHGVTIKFMADYLKRTNGAISSRLRKLGLKD